MTKVQCTILVLLWTLARSEEVADSWMEADGACNLQTRMQQTEENYVSNLVDQFLEAPLPSPNRNLTSENPLIFLHQARAAGTSIRKLISNSSRNLGLKAHIPCYGGVGCNDLRLEGEAAVYAGNFCWADAHRSLQEKGAKQVGCLTSFREPVPRIMSCYSDRLVGSEHVAPACMADLPAEQLKRLLVERGCVNEPFRRFSECQPNSTVSMDDPKGRQSAWQNTLDYMSQCVPIIVGRQVSLKVAANYFPQLADAIWDMKSLAVNRNTHYLNQGECRVPDTHMEVIKQLAQPETVLYEAAVKRMWQLMLKL
ncbi:unnamed protein product [Symbiodinium natans]|uniref:Transferrin-like domain-containing protein n=1 Tax=Symbiodinium natans TaxID=878477 RepID=A0A812UV91_9DINO|nr:unnamed protein product [Symbiodinium natans]